MASHCSTRFPRARFKRAKRVLLCAAIVLALFDGDSHLPSPGIKGREFACRGHRRVQNRGQTTGTIKARHANPWQSRSATVAFWCPGSLDFKTRESVAAAYERIGRAVAAYERYELGGLGLTAEEEADSIAHLTKCQGPGFALLFEQDWAAARAGPGYFTFHSSTPPEYPGWRSTSRRTAAAVTGGKPALFQRSLATGPGWKPGTCCHSPPWFW